MLRLFKTSFFWQFAGGFAVGAVGLFALQPEAVAQSGAHAVQPASIHATR